MQPALTASRAPVVVTGGAGYVGSVVVRTLLEAGRSVRVLDNFLYGNGSLPPPSEVTGLEVLSGDVRSGEDLDRVLRGADAVVHLAGLVGDPACALDPALTRAVNEESSRGVAEACRAHGVRRLVFASTCSVYGAAGDEWLDEDSPTRPLSLYAETNLRSEELLAEGLEGSGVGLSVLRFATVFGVSPRMRFDLVVNLLTARARSAGALEVHGGSQWRPQVHVRDVAGAIALAVARTDADGVFNVGSDEQNLRIAELAETIAGVFPGTRLDVLDVSDPRSYRVCFARISERWGFRAEHTVADGAREVAAYLETHGVATDEARFHNVRALDERLRRRTAS